MAARGSAAIRSGSNPLGGMLRDLNRRSRSAQQAQRRPGPPGEAGPPGERGPAGEPGPPGTVVLASVVETMDDGRAAWSYGRPLPVVPVVGAVAVRDDQDGPLTVVVEDVTTVGVTVRVWRARPILGLGLLPAVPVGSGVLVHMTAVPAPAPDTIG